MMFEEAYALCKNDVVKNNKDLENMVEIFLEFIVFVYLFEIC